MSKLAELSKTPEALRSIGEVGQELDLPWHVLHYWERQFAQIKPVRRARGPRFYRPEDIALLRGIKQMLYVEGYTIRGVKRVIEKHGVNIVRASSP